MFLAKSMVRKNIDQQKVATPPQPQSENGNHYKKKNSGSVDCFGGTNGYAQNVMHSGISRAMAHFALCFLMFPEYEVQNTVRLLWFGAPTGAEHKKVITK